ncbi:hypothetical protein D4T97_009035 [Siminovitchia acidinfaciens]|uniref:Lipoprotein n=1 Tax=Siminovitchia acidinfaciens TaxID=2321395 RepID=A0A429Y2E2_9BACI|nr:hypothetical protein [Siminovitchia acidinfaciens]RST75378.1 hypothetical protein D4T97_009035 [Siminovitchia acidinfaciens]
MKRLFAFVLVIIVISGCAQRLPEPEAEKAKAMESTVENKKEITVHHNVHGNTLYIECFIPGVSFSHAKAGSQLGKALLFIDGQLYNEYETAAFIVKGIPSGSHTFKIEIVDRDNQPLGISKEFTATVH